MDDASAVPAAEPGPAWSGAVAHADAALTQALLVQSLEARNRRLDSPEMLSTDGAAALAGVSRETINQWIRNGRCLALERAKRGYRLPRWQFEPRFRKLLPALFDAIGTREGWALLAFLESAQPALGGVTPRQAIERGEGDAVLALAAAEGTSDR